MAKIKLADRGRRPSRDIPSTTIQGGGIADKALQELGGTIGEIGAQLLERERNVASQNQLANAVANTNKSAALRRSEGDENFKGTDHEGFTKEVMSNFDGDVSSIRDSITSTKAKRLFDVKIRTMRSNNQIKLELDERSRRSTFFKVDDERIREESKKIGGDTTSFDDAAINQTDDVIGTDSMIGGIYTREEVALIREKDFEYAEQVVISKINNGGGHLFENRKFLNSPEGEHLSLHDAIPPKKLKQLNDLNEAAIKKEQGKTRKNTFSFAKDAIATFQFDFEKHGRVTPRGRQALDIADKRLSMLEQNRDVQQMRNVIDNRRILVEKQQKWKNFSMGELAAVDAFEEIDTGEGLQAADDLQTARSLRELQASMMQTMQKDPGKMIMATDKTVAPGTQEFIDAQTVRGYPFPKYADNATMQIEGRLLRENPDKVGALNDFLTRYPEGNKMLAQMQGERGMKDLANFVVASEVEDSGTRNLLLNTDPKEVSKNFGAKEFKEVKTAIKSELEDLFKAFGRNDKFINSVSDRLSVRAITHIENGESQSDAVEMAASLLSQEYSVATSGNNNILLKKADLQRQPQLQRDLQALMSRFSDTDNGSEFMQVLGVTKEAHGFVGTNEEFIQQVVPSMTFKLNADRDGVNAVYINDEGRSILLKQTKLEGDFPGAQNTRSPLNIPFEQVKSYHSPLADSIVREQAEEDTIFKVRSRIRSDLKRFGVPTKNLPPVDPKRVAAGLPDLEI